MQFQVVIERSEIIFIDHQGGYAVQDGEGGRLITLAWQFPRLEPRESLSKPVRIELVHYRQDVKALHRRIMSEFPPVLERLCEKSSGKKCKEPRILPFRSSDG